MITEQREGDTEMHLGTVNNVNILNTHKTCSLTIIVNVDCVTKNDAKLENIDKDIYLGVHINMWLRKIYRYLRRLPNKICDIIFFSYWSLI